MTWGSSAARSPLGVLWIAIVLGLIGVGCTSDSELAPTSTTSTTIGSTTSVGTPPSSIPGSTLPDTTTSTPTTVPTPTYVDENGFDDHTVPTVATVDELMALSRSGVGGQAAMKFTIPEFDRPADAADLARVHLMDGNFYGLHDEWYYFRLLNGQPIPGSGVGAYAGEQFATVAEIYEWAHAQRGGLPLGLEFFGDRLYSSDFYDLALHGEPRAFGVGSIVRFPDAVAGADDHWLIELEYTDEVTPEAVARFFTRLDPVLPAEVSSRLEWVVRSPQQEAVAAQMVANALPFHDRIVHYRDLVPAGQVAVYSDGIAAGRLLYVGEGGAQLTDAMAGDIVITERVPDWLPAAAALITSEPQTPLAHVNLLARNRGIPNASQAGIHDDAGLRQAARVRAHAIVIASGSTLQIALISREQYVAWQATQKPSPTAVPRVDITGLPLVVNLTDLVATLSADGLTEEDVAEWRPTIGGKSAGFLTLLSIPGLTPPPDPLAITIRPYVEHLAPIRGLIAAAISNPALTDSPRARWLVLEGGENYGDLFPTDADTVFAFDFVAGHPAGSPLGDVLAAGGVRALIESRQVAPDTLAAITAVLADTYGNYDSAAGLRFRSSSSVEDIEGFNGAGLYTSYTGYLDADQLDDPDDRDNTIERALLRAWSSYWTFEAFEERRQSAIDHLSGAMGLTVHARFDDDLEQNNGVATFTFEPGGGPDDAIVEINVQKGAVDVTNPDPQEIELPEVVRVTRRGGDVSIERVAGSTLLGDDEQVMNDAAIVELFEQTAAVAGVWRSRLNASLPAEQRVQTVVLDFEFKTVKAGWPMLADGEQPYPSRLVLRQVRSLDPGLRALPADVRALPAPRDIVMRASLVESVRCTVPGSAAVSYVEIFTDPVLAPDIGHSEQPFVVGVVAPSTATCTRRTLYASPNRALAALVVDGGAFVIIG